MSTLRVGIIQSRLIWEDPLASRNHLNSLLEKLEPTDLVVLPEMFSTGFSMKPEKVAEDFHPEMPTLVWMKNWAEKLDAAITGSVSVRDNGNHYNRLLWVEPDGKVLVYDKKHLFGFAGEDRHYTPGDQRLIVQFRNWKICPLICYDLRFPEWSRNFIENGQAHYDALLYVANWPQVRRDPWMKLLFARAIENQCYVLGVNRVGTDGNGIAYSGDSLILSPKGEIISQLEPDFEGVLYAELDQSELLGFREKFPVLHDASREFPGE